jgi:hypothetical protein
MSRKYRQLAERFLNSGMGGVGTVSIQPQQVGSVSIQPQQIGMPAAAANGGQQRIVSYNQASYNAGGLTLCQLPKVTIPDGTTMMAIHLNVRRPFLPQSLYMPSTVYGLDINDFEVEGLGLFAGAKGTGVPNELLSEVSNLEQIQWPTINPDTGADFIVSNNSGGPLVFSGAFWGTNVLRA